MDNIVKRATLARDFVEGNLSSFLDIIALGYRAIAYDLPEEEIERLYAIVYPETSGNAESEYERALKAADYESFKKEISASVIKRQAKNINPMDYKDLGAFYYVTTMNTFVICELNRRDPGGKLVYPMLGPNRLGCHGNVKFPVETGSFCFYENLFDDFGYILLPTDIRAKVEQFLKKAFYLGDVEGEIDTKSLICFGHLGELIPYTPVPMYRVPGGEYSRNSGIVGSDENETLCKGGLYWLFEGDYYSQAPAARPIELSEKNQTLRRKPALVRVDETFFGGAYKDLVVAPVYYPLPTNILNTSCDTAIGLWCLMLKIYELKDAYDGAALYAVVPLTTDEIFKFCDGVVNKDEKPTYLDYTYRKLEESLKYVVDNYDAFNDMVLAAARCGAICGAYGERKGGI